MARQFARVCSTRPPGSGPTPEGTQPSMPRARSQRTQADGSASRADRRVRRSVVARTSPTTEPLPPLRLLGAAPLNIRGGRGVQLSPFWGYQTVPDVATVTGCSWGTMAERTARMRQDGANRQNCSPIATGVSPQSLHGRAAGRASVHRSFAELLANTPRRPSPRNQEKKP